MSLKKIFTYWVALIGIGLVVLLAAVVVLGKSPTLRGKLVFFKDAPTVSEYMDAATLTRTQAVEILTAAALKAKRIDEAGRQKFLNDAARSGNEKITRGEFAKLAVQVFDMRVFGLGPVLSDVATSAQNAGDMYLFASNGGVESSFKPNNPAVRNFAEKAAENIARRLGGQ